MKVVITGGTGFIGRYLESRFRELNHEVFVVSRKSTQYGWDEQLLIELINGTDVLINLAGKTINCRHTSKNRMEILTSRLESTALLNKVIRKCQQPPKLFVNASASAIYRPTVELSHAENSTDFDNSFLADVVKQWENRFFEITAPTVRKVALRTSVVLGENGGALSPLYLLTHLGLGGRQGNGKQMFSWIHIEDYFQIILFAINNNTVEGVVNCTSPSPVANAQLMKGLRKVCKMPIGIPAPAFVIKMGAFFIGTESSLLLNSVNFKPEKLIESGYQFKYPNLMDALRQLYR